MEQKNDYRRLFELSFGEDRSWIDWMMHRVYDDADLLMLHDERQRAVSAMLLRRYDMMYLGQIVPAGYIYGACTHPQARGHGYMGQLMREALRLAAERGDACVWLVPANEALYDYYSQFGFGRTVFVDRQRYTTLHRFTVEPGFVAVEPRYEDFRRLEGDVAVGVLHSADDYACVLEDLRGDGGEVFAVGRDGQVEAMAFAAPKGDDAVLVKALFAEGGSQGPAAEAVLQLVRDHFGRRQVIVDSFPGRGGARLQARGMMRVTDVRQLLAAIAAYDRSLTVRVRIHDSILADNCGVFSIAGGECRRESDAYDGKVDIDADISVLACILCSSRGIASVIGLPADYARLPLMLD